MFCLRSALVVLCLVSSVAMAADEKGWFLANSVAERGPGMAGLCSGVMTLEIKGPQEQDECDGFFDVLFYADLKTRKVYWSKSAVQKVNAPDYKRSVVEVLRNQLQSEGKQTLEDMRGFYFGERNDSEMAKSESADAKVNRGPAMVEPTGLQKRPIEAGVSRANKKPEKQAYIESNPDLLIEFKTAYAEQKVRGYRFACPQPGKSASLIDVLRLGVLDASSTGGGVRKLYATVDSRGDEIRIYHQVRGTDGYLGPSHVVMTIDKWGELRLHGVSKEALMLQCYKHF